MYSKKPIEELVTCILQELERRNYAENSRNCYRTFYNRVVKFAKNKSEEYYSEDIVRNFLESSYNFKLSDYGKAIPRRLRSPVRFIRVLYSYDEDVPFPSRNQIKAFSNLTWNLFGEEP